MAVINWPSAPYLALPTDATPSVMQIDTLAHHRRNGLAAIKSLSLSFSLPPSRSLPPSPLSLSSQPLPPPPYSTGLGCQ